MSDVNLGAVKAKLELDASGVEDGVNKASKALQGLRSGLNDLSGLLTDGVDAWNEYSKAIAVTEDLLKGIGAGYAAAAAAIVFATKAVVDAAIETSKYVESLEKMELATGLSADMLQSLGKAAAETNVSMTTVQRSVTTLERAIANNNKAFATLGISLQEIKSASPDEQIKLVTDRLLEMSDVTERNAAAQQLLGRGFIESLPALQAYTEAGDRYVNLTGDQIEAGRALDNALDATKTAWTELWQQIGAAVASPEVSQGISEIGSSIRELAKDIQDNREAIGWFFKLLAFGPGGAAGLEIHKLGAAALDMATGMGNELPGVKTPSIFQPQTLNIAGPSAFEDERQKQQMAAVAEAEKEAEKAAKAEQRRQETIADLLQRARTSAAREGQKIMIEQGKLGEATVAREIKAEADKYHEELALAKNHQTALIEIARNTTDIQRALLQDQTLSFKQQQDIQLDMMRAQFDERTAVMEKQLDAAINPEDKAAIQAQIDAWQQVEAHILKAAEAAAKYAEILHTIGQVSTILGQLGTIFQQLGVSADSFLGRLTSGLGNAAKAASAGVSSFQALQNGLAQGGLGGILGAVSGGLGVVSAGIGIVKSIVGIFSKPEYKKIMSDVGKSWGTTISESLAKEIENIEKTQHISKSLAELLDTSKIIGESGKDPREFTSKINDLMNAIKAGSVPAAQGMAELGKSFSLVADAALKAGTIGDKALVSLLKRARELGEVTPEMKAFVSGQLDAATEGIKQLLDALPANTDLAASGEGALTAATFNAIAAEKGIVAATEALGPSYDKLMKQISEAGIAIPDSLAAIGRQIELGRNKDFAAASTAASATTQALTGLGNAGYMDASVLGGAGDIAKQTFDQAKAAGATDKEAYQAIGGLLAGINNASVQSGIALTGIERELISGAQAEGVKIGEDQLSVLTDIRNILAGGSAAAYSGGAAGGGTASAYGGGAGASPDYSGGLPEAGNYTPRGAGRYGFAGGSYGVKDFGAGTPVTLHGREAVVTEKDYNRMQGGGGITLHATFGATPTQTYQDRQQLSRFQIQEVLTALRNDPVFIRFVRSGGDRA